MNNIKWNELPFGYQKTDYNLRCYFRNGEWGEVETSSSEHINIHMAATCLHYGQEAFEGMKAFMGNDGNVRIFRWEDNWKRMNNSARGILMEEVPADIFKKCITTAIQKNSRFIPPYGSGASLYLRPLLIGTGAKVGISPADEYLFMVFVTPVGPYFKEGFSPVEMMITRKYDRAAPLGTGSIKVGGNYAAGLKSMKEAKDNGFASVLFLDAKEKKYLDECGPANFFGIKGNKYVTPKSDSILPSITNKSLCQIAEDIGMEVERRPIEAMELEEFDEAGACGTAAVISPIKRIIDIENKKSYDFCKDDKAGPISTKLYEKLQAIQTGDEPDKFGWIELIECSEDVIIEKGI